MTGLFNPKTCLPRCINREHMKSNKHSKRGSSPCPLLNGGRSRRIEGLPQPLPDVKPRTRCREALPRPPGSSTTCPTGQPSRAASVQRVCWRARQQAQRRTRGDARLDYHGGEGVLFVAPILPGDTRQTAGRGDTAHDPAVENFEHSLQTSSRSC